MKIILGVLVTMMLFAPSAKATPTAGSLVQVCSSDKEVEAATCVSYITGFMDAISGVRVSRNNGTVVEVIFADGVTSAQIARVFIKYMAGHPETENKLALGELVDALVDAKLMGFKPVILAAQAH